jgi:hypothetical protein
VILGEADRVAHGVGAKPEQRRGRRGSADRAPCARRVVRRVPGVQRDAGTDGHLVPDGDRGEEALRRRAGELGGGQGGGDDVGTRMALREPVAVVHVQRVGEDAIAPCGTEHAEPPPVEQRRRVGARMHGGGVVRGDPRRRHSPSGDRHGGEVSQQVPEAALRPRGDVRPPQALDEVLNGAAGYLRRPGAGPRITRSRDVPAAAGDREGPGGRGR